MDKLRQLLEELNVADAKGSPAEKIDQLASQIRALVVDGDDAAVEAQAIALIQHDKFEAALEVLGRGDSTATQQGLGLVLRDYCLYKLRRLEGLAPNYQTLDQENRALVLIHAQNVSEILASSSLITSSTIERGITLQLMLFIMA